MKSCHSKDPLWLGNQIGQFRTAETIIATVAERWKPLVPQATAVRLIKVFGPQVRNMC
jgi:hypothetical protein